VADVEAATKTALAFTFDVNPKLIEVTATKARRLESDTRHLAANTWTVTYVLQVAESKSAVLKKTIANMQKNPTDFAGKLEAAVNDLPSTSGARKTISITIAAAAATKFTVTLTTTTMATTVAASKAPTAPIDEAVVAGCRTSQWLSGVIAVLVALIGSM